MEMFRECGFMAFVVSGASLLALALALVALALAIFKPRWGLVLSVVALCAACSSPAAGVAGTLLGRQKVAEVLDSRGLDPAQAERIRREGELEAAQCTNLGLAAGALPALASVVALGVSAVRRRKS